MTKAARIMQKAPPYIAKSTHVYCSLASGSLAAAAIISLNVDTIKVEQ
jgi:hypothetical protein